MIQNATVDYHGVYFEFDGGAHHGPIRLTWADLASLANTVGPFVHDNYYVTKAKMTMAAEAFETLNTDGPFAMNKAG